MAEGVFRPISRKYDRAEHAYPVELDMLAAIMDGMNDGTIGEGRRRRQTKRVEKKTVKSSTVPNMVAVLGS